MANKIIVPVVLITLAAGGFYLASRMIAKKAVTVGGKTYRASVYLGEGGQWYAQVFEGGKPIGETIGPLPSEEDAAEQAAAYLAGLDVVAFYTLHSHEDAPGKYTWYFDGWSRGAKITEANGPYASEAIANVAGSLWAETAVKEQVAA